MNPIFPLIKQFHVQQSQSLIVSSISTITDSKQATYLRTENKNNQKNKKSKKTIKFDIIRNTTLRRFHYLIKQFQVQQSQPLLTSSSSIHRHHRPQTLNKNKNKNKKNLTTKIYWLKHTQLRVDFTIC